MESWSQTLDFSKKKKGTQCDAIEVEAADTQVIAQYSECSIHLGISQKNTELDYRVTLVVEYLG